MELKSGFLLRAFQKKPSIESTYTPQNPIFNLEDASNDNDTNVVVVDEKSKDKVVVPPIISTTEDVLVAISPDVVKPLEKDAIKHINKILFRSTDQKNTCIYSTKIGLILLIFLSIAAITLVYSDSPLLEIFHDITEPIETVTSNTTIT